MAGKLSSINAFYGANNFMSPALYLTPTTWGTSFNILIKRTGEK